MGLFNRKNKKERRDAEDSTADAVHAENEARANQVLDDEVGKAIMGMNPGTTMQVASEDVTGDVESVRARRRRRGDGSSAQNFDFASLDAAAEKIAAERAKDNEDEDDDDAVIDVSKLSKSQRKALREAAGDKIDIYPHLLALKPREGYVFHSDWFEVDDQAATVVSFFHNDEAKDTFGAFWGVNRIPRDLGEGVTVVTMEQVSRRPDKWVEYHLRKSEKLDKLEDREQSEGGGRSSRRKAAKVADDMMWATAEYQDGATYLNVHNRLILRAPNLDALDEALSRLRQLYIDRFPSVHTAPYHGEQRQEMGNLMSFNKKKHGKGFGYTSTEFAGSYSLVTNGLNDPTGEYVGYMRGDVNNSAILFDVNKFSRQVVLADETVNPRLHRQRMVDMWGSKLSQACLADGHRVVHLVLNDAKLDLMGPKFESITSKVDMTNGEVNMFEVFGDVEDELSLFPVHVRKLVLMAAQVLKSDAEVNGSDGLAIVNGKLGEILKTFYIDQRMWVADAKKHRDELRLVGIPHQEVPLLHVFQAYLDEEHNKEIMKGDKKDEDISRALATLSMIFRSLLDSNGDLFDQYTDPRIDRINEARRVVYEFSGLSRRGPGIAMAQLINVVNFAVESLGQGDLVILHGSDSVTDESVQLFLSAQFDRLKDRGGRVAYLYDGVDSMLYNQHFNQYSRADYTVLGPMSVETVNGYQEQMQQVIPRDLANLVTMRDSGQSYLRRGSTNVVFYTDLALMVNKTRKARKQARKQVRDDHRDQVAAGEAENQETVRDDSARNPERGGGTGIHTDAFDGESSAALAASKDSREKRLAGASKVAELEAAEAEAKRERVSRMDPESGSESSGSSEPEGHGSPQTESGGGPRRGTATVNSSLGTPRRTLQGAKR